MSTLDPEILAIGIEAYRASIDDTDRPGLWLDKPDHAAALAVAFEAMLRETWRRIEADI